ncbi:MAG: hypothetical protein SGPRY_009917, partial [Prymnesium sp.]
MPFAVKRVGVPAALVLTLVIGVWSTYTMQLLAWSVCLLENRRSRAPSYEQLVSAAFGKLLGRACTANLVLSQIATCSAYLVFIGENLAQVVGVESYKVMQALLLPFVLLCWVRDMRTLMATSALGTVCLAVCLLLVMCDASQQPRHNQSWLYSIPPDPSGVASFLGVSLFTFTGHSEVIAIVQSLGEERWRYKQITQALCALGIPAIFTFAVVAYEGYGPRTEKNIFVDRGKDEDNFEGNVCIKALLDA